MSLLRYLSPLGSDTCSSSSSLSNATALSGPEESADNSAPATKRSKTSDDQSRLSPAEIDAILIAEVPDLGLFPVAFVRNTAATCDRLKEKLLKSRFSPYKTWVAPKRQCGEKKRSVSADFFNPELYPCIRYSVSKDGLYCVACVLFGCQKVVLTTEPLTDWSNARRLISKHQKTSDHKFAQQKSVDFLRVCDREQLGIVQHMTKAEYELIRHNTKVLHAIISLIAACGKQNVPIRGKTAERSNFMAFLNFRAEADNDLEQHLRSCPKNAKYTSHRIQNEIISLCGNQIRNNIMTSIKAAGVYSVLADESADVSCTEQVAICIRYAKKEDKVYTAHEDFLTFLPTRDTSGETLSNLILTQIAQWGLDPANIVGQGYDGAGNMSGHTRGAQARISNQYPTATYVHCKNHSLNLAIVHACKQRVVSNMFTAVREML